MKKRWVAIIVVFIFPVLARADIYTPVTLNISAHQISQILNNGFAEGLSIDKKLKQMPELEGLDIQAEGISYKAKFFPYFSIDDRGQVQMELSVQEVELKVEHFDARYTLVQNHGSLHVNVLTDIKCDSLSLVSQSPIRLQAFGQLKKAGPQVNHIKIHDEPDLKIRSKTCEAPEGYETKLVEIANEWLLSQEGLDEILHLVNDEVIADYWQDFKKGLEFNLVGRKIYIALVDLDFYENVQAKIQIRWPYKNQILLNTNFSNSSDTLTYSISDLNKILKLWFPQECFQLDFNRKDIPSASALFESRFMQFFAWSDLMNFPKDINFKLYIRLCVNEASVSHALPNGLTINHKSILLAQINLIQNGRELPYVVAWGQGVGRLSILSQENGIALGLEGTKFEMDSRFHSGMSKWRGNKKPGGKPSMSMIMPRVLDGLQANPISVADEFAPAFRNLNFGSGNGELYFKK